MKKYEFKINTSVQNWQGSTDMNGNTNIDMDVNLNCTDKHEEAFHQWFKATKKLHKICGGINKIEFEPSQD